MRLRNWRSLRSRRRSGTEILELALILGLILLPIVFGTIEFGTYFFVEHNLQAAAREGARSACVRPEAEWFEAMQAAVERSKQGSSLNQFEQDGMQIDASYETIIDENEIKYIAVTVRTTWDQVPQGLRPMLMIRNAENHELKGYAVMRCEVPDEETVD